MAPPIPRERLQQFLADLQHHLAMANRSVTLNPAMLRAPPPAPEVPAQALTLSPQYSANLSFSFSVPDQVLPNIEEPLAMQRASHAMHARGGAGGGTDAHAMSTGAALLLALLSSTFLVLTLGSLLVVLCCVRRRRFRVDQVRTLATFSKCWQIQNSALRLQ